MSQPIEPNGLVIEDQNGNRLLAIPTAIVEILRYAAVIQYVQDGRVHRMRVDGFTDGRQGGQPVPPLQPTPSAAQLEPVNPSPTTPPAQAWRCRNVDCQSLNSPDELERCAWCQCPRPITERALSGPGTVRGIDGNTEGA